MWYGEAVRVGTLQFGKLYLALALGPWPLVLHIPVRLRTSTTMHSSDHDVLPIHEAKNLWA